MLKCKKLMASVVVVVGGLLAASSANASLINFAAQWQGTTANAGSAAATFTVDDTFWINGGINGLNGWITALSLTVSGAASGNGTFGLADFIGNSGHWNMTAPVNLSAEIVGQSGHFDLNFCGPLNGAPVCVGANSFFADGLGFADRLILSSLRTTVPEPATLGLFGLGLAGLGLATRRRKTA